MGVLKILVPAGTVFAWVCFIAGLPEPQWRLQLGVLAFGGTLATAGVLWRKSKIEAGNRPAERLPLTLLALALIVFGFDGILLPGGLRWDNLLLPIILMLTGAFFVVYALRLPSRPPTNPPD